MTQITTEKWSNNVFAQQFTSAQLLIPNAETLGLYHELI